MEHLEEIAERMHKAFEARTATRDLALAQARSLTRCCSNAIRAVHRDETELALSQLNEASRLFTDLRKDLADYPDIYFAGYTQDALKEYAEACIVYAVINHQPLPSPEDLEVEYDSYLQGLAESVGEMRRRCLDILRHGYSDEAERLLAVMDDIYAVMITMDYPSAVTGGVRRLTDTMRGIVERTRGDLTISLRQEHLEMGLRSLEDKLRKDQVT